MKLLALISKHSTLLMPLLSIIGLLLPELSNAVLPWLASILFFLMFFTLLGIDQQALFKKMRARHVWFFAVFQNSLTCLVVTLVAFLCGARGALLLAISAISATSPLFGSGAIVNAMGFDALQAMAKTIAATLVLPVTLLLVLLVFAEDNAYLDLFAYVKRLFIYIVCPIVLAVVLRKIIPKATLARYYPKVAQFNILLLLAFPLGLMGGFRASFDTNPWAACQLFVIAVLLVVSIFAMTFVVYRKFGFEQAVIASTISSGRNVLLTYTIALPFLGSIFLPLIGALQLPMFSVPFIGKMLLKYHQPSKTEH